MVGGVDSYLIYNYSKLNNFDSKKEGLRAPLYTYGFSDLP
jgi:hypothetical protein